MIRTDPALASPGRGLIDYHLDITPSTVFDNRLLVESGSANTLINNDAAVKGCDQTIVSR